MRDLRKDEKPPEPKIVPGFVWVPYFDGQEYTAAGSEPEAVKLHWTLVNPLHIVQITQPNKYQEAFSRSALILTGAEDVNYQISAWSIEQLALTISVAQKYSGSFLP